MSDLWDRDVGSHAHLDPPEWFLLLLIRRAWALLSTVDDGEWSGQSPEWTAEASRWRVVFTTSVGEEDNDG
jgi:hypothetical protein